MLDITPRKIRAFLVKYNLSPWTKKNLFLTSFLQPTSPDTRKSGASSSKREGRRRRDNGASRVKERREKKRGKNSLVCKRAGGVER